MNDRPEHSLTPEDSVSHPEDNQAQLHRRSGIGPRPTRNALFADKSAFTGAAVMGIFSRTRDIIAANFAELLDQSDDPAKMIRMIILEMEETLVEVRASAARTIADQKELHRHAARLDKLQADWAEKAQLALSRGREDLARAALLEKRKAADMAEQLKAEAAVLDEALRAYEADIHKLQSRLREARSRQSQIAARLESAENRYKLRSLMTSERVDEALARFDQLERRVDLAEGRADAVGMGGSGSLADEFAA
ncbi:MAG: phage shock protein PspA, partial [Alteraurantiacibacter sp.]|nr:phage shock protein PspA [Alteraurantiacibacter sp.]